MKQILTTILVVSSMISIANAGDRFSDLNYDYFYGKNSNVSLNVKVTIANDPETSPKVLEILIHDENIAVWLLAKNNLKKAI